MMPGIQTRLCDLIREILCVLCVSAVKMLRMKEPPSKVNQDTAIPS